MRKAAAAATAAAIITTANAPCKLLRALLFSEVCEHQDSLAEWSKALASGASPQGRGLEPHSCQLYRSRISMGQQWSGGFGKRVCAGPSGYVYIYIYIYIHTHKYTSFPYPRL